MTDLKFNRWSEKFKYKTVPIEWNAAVLAALDGTVTDAAGDKIEGNVTISRTPTEAQLKTINDGTNASIQIPAANQTFMELQQY